MKFMGSKRLLVPFLLAVCVSLIRVRVRSEVLPIPGATGPESLAFDGYGAGPYTGVSDGRILKWQSGRWINFAVTTPNRYGCEGPQDHVYTEARCGRPLGLSFNKRTGYLYIADAYMGLLVVGPNGGLATPVARAAQGVPFRFTNGVVVDQNSGVVYFTDSSTRFPRSQFAYVMSSRDNSGRLLRYDPRINQVTVLLNNLMFPNGVALSKNGDFLLVAETTNSRILRYWLEPSRAGKVEIFAQLPGRPDGIKMNQYGQFWAPVNTDFGYGLIVKLSPNGNIIQVLEPGEWRYGSDVDEEYGNLWIGSVVEPHVVHLRV